MVEKIHGNFPTLFDQMDDGEEDADTEGESRGVEEQGRGAKDPYGIIPYVLTYCRVTNETISEAYKGSVNHLFFIVTYETERLMKENDMRRRYMKGGYSEL